jgi:vacuolar protein sorting-associated protein 18
VFEQAEHVYYKHASILLARAPAAASESFLLRYHDGLSPVRLLPAIMKYESIRSARKRAQGEQSKLEAKGGVEETKSDNRYSIGGPNESSDGFEIKFEADLNVASFVDDSTVAIKYLEGVISQGCRHGAVFRYLLSLYIALEDEEPLLEFLSQHVSGSNSIIDAAKRAILQRDKSPNTENLSNAPLDISYALRAVLKSGRHFRSAIKLYMGFGMRQQAVELALKVDPSLARNLAQGSVEPEERKRLWLMIAKSSATDGSRGGKDVVSRVVSVLKDCGPDVLSIEDVLPFLPDFAQIDQIKDEICRKPMLYWTHSAEAHNIVHVFCIAEALTSYSSKIDGFLREMSDCDQLCESVRNEISRLKNHQMKLRTDARCAITNQRIVAAGEPFYVFPSGFVFLASALKDYVVPLLDEDVQVRVGELSKRIAAEDAESRAKLQGELDGILALDCPFTGSRMVDSIDKGFDVDEDEGLSGLETTDVDRVDV